MKKKVIVIEPWSSKFLSMKHTPWILNKNEDWKELWKDTIDVVKVRDNALEDCRLHTEKFWEKIK